MNIVTLCTGNVARSVMLGYMLTTLADANGEDWSIRTAGTHVIEGSSMSSRTRDALLKLDELGVHHFGGHRSHQVDDDDVRWCDVMLACEAANVDFVRTHHGDGAAKAVIFQQFLREAPLDVDFDEQVRYVASLEPLAYFNVEDPAGKDQAAYDACAEQLWEMAQVFATLETGDEL
jgi:protein-tyrosine-phosphatase